MIPSEVVEGIRPASPDLDPDWSEKTLQQILSTKRPRRKRAIAIAVGAAAVALPLAAGAIVQVGSEFVDQIPPKGIIMGGVLDGERYWMVESLHNDDCGNRLPGVEIVVEESNLVGQEWKTGGINYGQEMGNMKQGFCGYDTSKDLADASRYNSGGTGIGDDAFLWSYAVHPSVTALQVVMDGATQQVTTYPLNGARYAVVEVPGGTEEFTVRLLDGQSVIPGSENTIQTPH